MLYCVVIFCRLVRCDSVVIWVPSPADPYWRCCRGRPRISHNAFLVWLQHVPVRCAYLLFHDDLEAQGWIRRGSNGGDRGGGGSHETLLYVYDIIHIRLCHDLYYWLFFSYIYVGIVFVLLFLFRDIYIIVTVAIFLVLCCFLKKP